VQASWQPGPRKLFIKYNDYKEITATGNTIFLPQSKLDMQIKVSQGAPNWSAGLAYINPDKCAQAGIRF
jgi:hypothetical protein